MDQQVELSLSQRAFESLVLSYCDKYVGVPGTKQLREYLNKKLGQDSIPSTYVNGFDRQFLELTEILQDDYFIMYHICVMHPESLQSYDIYLNSEPDEQNDDMIFPYYSFLRDMEAQDPLIDDFVRTLVSGKAKRVAFIDKEDLMDISNLRLIKENDVVHDFSDFEAWNRSEIAKRYQNEL